MACALSPTFSWLKRQLSSPVPWFFPPGTSLALRKLVWFLRRLGASWVIFATLTGNQGKKDRFAELREAILGKKSVSVTTLQKLAGKTTSFALLVPAAKLYSNSMYQAISQASKSCSRQVKLSPTLRKEISHWRFLDSWQGCLPWRNESHLPVQLFSDASDFGWGGCPFSPGQPKVVILG